MKSYLVIVMLSLLCIPDFVQAQILTYKIIWKDDSIGFLRSTRIDKGDKKEFLLESSVEFNILFSFELDYDFSSKFSYDTLVYAQTLSKMNGKERSYSKVNKKEKNYHIEIDGNERILEKDLIDYAITMIYFNEPVGRSEIFSERYCEFLKINDLSDNKYELIKPNGKKNIYTFGNDGICREVEIDNTFTTFFFRLTGNEQ